MDKPQSKSSFTDFKVYRFIDKNKGLSTYEISKKLKMSGGRVRAAIIRLEKHGYIKTRYEQRDHKIIKIAESVPYYELIDLKESEHKEASHSEARMPMLARNS